MGTTNFSDVATDDGTWKAGGHTVVASEASAVDSVAIVTGLTSITGYIVQIFRSNVPVFSDQAVSVSGGTITVANGASTYEVTIGDVICWMAIGS